MRLLLTTTIIGSLALGCAGADGKDGATGADGEDGATGADGEDGATGADGEDGATGADGEDGAPGEDGEDGAPGEDGEDGAPGEDGEDGAPGEDGEDGICADVVQLEFIGDGVSWTADSLSSGPINFTAHLNDTGLDVSLAFYGLTDVDYTDGVEFTAALTEPASFVVMATDGCTIDLHTVAWAPAEDPDPVTEPGEISFTYTGDVQYFTVPDGVTTISVDAYGGAGGDTDDGILGGHGGYVGATIAVTPGEVLEVYVGQLGPTSVGGVTTTLGGYNGGGSVNRASGDAGGGTGGGATDIRAYPYELGDRLLVAGGGGGGGWSPYAAEGGRGGGLVGGDGYSSSASSYPPGQGGTQTAGGVGAYFSSEYPNEDGSFGNGGACWHDGAECGAGGGGWYGGGGGAFAGGGGGSSYTVPGASDVAHIQGDNPGDGELVISW